MFTFTANKNVEPTKLEELIDELIEEMRTIETTSNEYATMADQLVKLYSLKTVDQNRNQKISPDTLAVVVGNLAGILLIVGFEKANVMTSKALGFLLRTQK